MGKSRSRSRKTLGLLIGRLQYNNAFTYSFWKTLYNQTQPLPYNLLLVQGRSPDLDQVDGWADTAVYRMLNSRLLDGAIVTQMVLGHMNPSHLAQFVKDVPAIPSVTLAIKAGHNTCIKVDNTQGMRQLMRHLTDVHGCRKIVHIRGPYPHPQAEIRERIWREELARVGVEPPDRWLVPGSFDGDKMGSLGRDLMEQTAGDFEAVVACNDTAALRIIEDLQSMGRRVPEDYLVCGFDDIGQARLATPTLTTVSQQLEAQARCALEALVEWIETGTPPPDRQVDTSLVIRESCSCRPPEDEADEEKGPGLRRLADHQQLDLSQIQQKVHHLSNFIRALNFIHDEAPVAAILHQWLPRLGFHKFALFLTSNREGVPQEHLLRRGDNGLPAPPPYFKTLTTLPACGIPPEAISEAELGDHPWFAAAEPFALGMFPLAMEESWYGLVYLEISQETGVFQLAVQEQLASVFHRLYRERHFIEKNTEERTRTHMEKERTEALSRLVSGVAHEINTPLGAIMSCNATISQELLEFMTKTPVFFSGLSNEGMRWYEDLLVKIPKIPVGSVSGESRRQIRVWKEALERVSCSEPGRTAEELSVIGFSPDLQAFEALVIVPGYEQIVRHLAQVADLVKASQVIAVASEKASQFVTTLRNTGSY